MSEILANFRLWHNADYSEVKMKTQTKNILLGLIVFVAIAAGGHLVLKGDAQKKPAKIGVAVQGFNYTYEGVQGFTVNDGAGANVTPYGGGGEVCCVFIPGKWTPELKATVRWTIGHFTKPWSERGHLTVEAAILNLNDCVFNI